MKKIMLAMMATVGLAFFAKAEETTKYPGSTDFEDGEFFVVGNALPETDKGSGTEPAAFWANYVPAESESKIVAGGPNGSTKYASLDTDDKVLLRQAEAGNTVAFGSIYFDTMVQFTASEGDTSVSTSDGDKLMIWLQSNEASEGEEASTNLMIRAGLLDDDFDATESQDYQVEGEFEAGVWYRLTVKTFASIGLAATVPGFKVYIDGEEVSVTEGSPALYNGYFASLVSRAVGTQRLTGIGFQGTGAVDNIAMTSEDPIPPEGTYTLEFTPDSDFSDNVYQVTVDGAEGDPAEGFETDGIGISKTTVTVVVKTSDVSGTVKPTTEAVGVTFSKVETTSEVIEEEGSSYTDYTYTFTVTVAEPAVDANYAIALSFVPGEVIDEDIDLETQSKLSLDKDSIKEGEAAPTVTVMAGYNTLTVGTDYTVTTDYVAGTSKAGAYTITVTAVANSGYTGLNSITFTVTAEEPTTVVTPTAAEIESGKITVTEETTAIKVGGVDVSIDAFDVVGTTATVKAPVVAESAEAAGDAFVIDDENDEVTINVNPVAGLYYGVSAATDLDALARPAALTQYDGTNAAEIFTVSKPGDEKGFFKVYSDVKE